MNEAKHLIFVSDDVTAINSFVGKLSNELEGVNVEHVKCVVHLLRHIKDRMKKIHLKTIVMLERISILLVIHLLRMLLIHFFIKSKRRVKQHISILKMVICQALFIHMILNISWLIRIM